MNNHQRMMREQQTIHQKFPPNTRPLTVEGIQGWYYKFVNELTDQYEMFVYYDGSLYQVQIAFPEVTGQYGVHDAHLFNDGRICFGDEGGMPTLEQAYAKSVLWANGFSIFQQTGLFPFSLNNL